MVAGSFNPHLMNSLGRAINTTKIEQQAETSARWFGPSKCRVGKQSDVDRQAGN
jgi:hypothetical protein